MLTKSFEIIFHFSSKSRYKPLFSLRNKEDSPQAAVIIDETKGLERHLRNNRIGAWKWPGEELLKADEIFLSGTVKNIIPVSILDNRPVGNGKPGPITRKMMELYSRLLERFD